RQLITAQLQRAVSESSITQTMPKFPLGGIAGSFIKLLNFRVLMVIIVQTAHIAGVGVGQLTSWIYFSGQNISDNITALISQQVGLKHSCYTRLNFRNYSRSPIRQHQYYRLSGCRKLFSKKQLRF